MVKLQDCYSFLLKNLAARTSCRVHICKNHKALISFSSSSSPPRKLWKKHHRDYSSCKFSAIMSSKKAKTKNDASSSRGCMSGVSIVADCGRNRSTCGYCKSSARSSISHGSLTHH